MNIQFAKACVGKLVMSLDSGTSRSRRGVLGPFVLQHITKGGMAILWPYPHQVPPRHLLLMDNQNLVIEEPDYSKIKWPPDAQEVVSVSIPHLDLRRFRSLPIEFQELRRI